MAEMRRHAVAVPQDHPAFAGHFPGQLFEALWPGRQGKQDQQFPAPFQRFERIAYGQCVFGASAFAQYILCLLLRYYPFGKRFPKWKCYQKESKCTYFCLTKKHTR